MEKLNSLEEVTFYLKNNQVITSNGNDVFYLKNGLIIHKFNGSMNKMKPELFLELYKDTSFYYKDDKEAFIDLNKDEDYYGRIQRKN